MYKLRSTLTNAVESGPRKVIGYWQPQCRWSCLIPMTRSTFPHLFSTLHSVFLLPPAACLLTSVLTIERNSNAGGNMKSTSNWCNWRWWLYGSQCHCKRNVTIRWAFFGFGPKAINRPLNLAKKNGLVRAHREFRTYSQAGKGSKTHLTQPSSLRNKSQHIFVQWRGIPKDCRLNFYPCNRLEFLMEEDQSWAQGCNCC